MHLPEPLVAWEYEIERGLVLRGARTQSRQRPLIHFIHGNGFSSLTYWTLLHSLSQHFDLFLQDVQGHGESDNGKSFVGWNATADRCSTVFEAFKHHYSDCPVYLVGHSFGAIMSLLMSRLQRFPVAGMVLLDPVLYPPLFSPFTGLASLDFFANLNPMARQAKARQSSWTSFEEARHYLQDRGIFKGWHPQALEDYVYFATIGMQDGTRELKCPGWMEGKIFASFPQRVWRSIRALTVRTRIIYGDKTMPFIPYAARRAVARNSNFDLLSTTGGHCFMLQQPQVCTQLIQEFIREDW